MKFVDAEGKTVYDASKGLEDDESPSRKRTPQGEITPNKAYEIPVLQALVQLDGSGTADSVLRLVEERMRASFRPKDFELIPSGMIRWRKGVNWTRYAMKKKGLIKSDSPRGIWEISEKGREYLKQVESKAQATEV